jgi:hypothetical protein
MISYSRLRTILENNTALSKNGHEVLKSALTLTKPFSIIPSHLDRQMFATMTSQGIELIVVSSADLWAISNYTEGYQQRMRALVAQGYEVIEAMNVYPDDEFALISVGTRSRLFLEAVR